MNTLISMPRSTGSAHADAPRADAIEPPAPRDLATFAWARDDQALVAGVLDLMTEGLVLFDEQRRFVFCNETYRSYYPKLADLLVPGTPFAEIVRASIERGQLALSGGQDVNYVDERLSLYDTAESPHEQQLADGRWLRIAERRLANGYVLGTRTDITEIKNRQRAHAQSEQRLIDAVNALQEGFALFDAEDRLVICNEKYRSYFPLIRELVEPGVPFEELIRRAAERGQNVESAADPEPWIAARLRAHAQAHGTFEHQFYDGRYVWVSEHKTADGSTLSTYFDVTALKLREKELERANRTAEVANRAKSEFLANMSHELRTPLNAIIGFTEVMVHQMLGPIENERYRSYLDNILESGSHLLRMVNDLLDYEKMQSNQVTLNEEITEITEIVSSSMSLLAHRAKTSDIALYSEQPEESPWLRIDPLAIKKALINLIANALKFTQPGGAVAVVCKTLDDGDIIIRVTDNGIGIAEDDIERILIPFVQVGDRSDVEGTGLGLSITKALVELHEGRLDIASRLGEGTTVTITLPKSRVVAAPASAGAEQRAR